MRRTPMKPGKGFRRPEMPKQERAPLKPRSEPARAVIRAATKFVEPVLKDNVVRSEPYLRLVASLPCWRCGIHGYTQAAHGDEGKGLQIKACDLTAWPACGPHDFKIGCHALVGSTGAMPREDRRRLEKRAAADTQAMLIGLSQNNPRVRRVLIAVGLVKG
jgi:hypothetical protein